MPHFFSAHKSWVSHVRLRGVRVGLAVERSITVGADAKLGVQLKLSVSLKAISSARIALLRLKCGYYVARESV